MPSDVSRMRYLLPKETHSYGSFTHAVTNFNQIPDQIVIQHKGKIIFTKTAKNPNPLQIYLTKQMYIDGVIQLEWQNLSSSRLHYTAQVSKNNFGQDDFSKPPQNVFLNENQINADGKNIFKKIHLHLDLLAILKEIYKSPSTPQMDSKLR